MFRRCTLGFVLAVVVVAAFGCTATRTREFVHEVYAAPAVRSAAARVFSETPEALYRALVAVLNTRGATVLQRDDEAGTISARVPWSSATEARESVDLGRIHRTIARTKRSYRSWSPLHFRCEECVIERGDLTGEQTELIEDEIVALDADRYRLEARLAASTETVRSGTRLELALEVDADPADPAQIAPSSTGLLEDSLFDAIEVALVR